MPLELPNKVTLFEVGDENVIPILNRNFQILSDLVAGVEPEILVGDGLYQYRNEDGKTVIALYPEALDVAAWASKATNDFVASDFVDEHIISDVSYNTNLNTIPGDFMPAQYLAIAIPSTHDIETVKFGGSGGVGELSFAKTRFTERDGTLNISGQEFKIYVSLDVITTVIHRFVDSNYAIYVTAVRSEV